MSDQELRSELRRFLKDRRARIRPADVGLPANGRRRVRGLRREEVAILAGIGVSWYTSLENGEADGVSEQTLIAVADALHLSDSERKYLWTLTGFTPIDDLNQPDELMVQTMFALTFPAYIIVASWDILYCNEAFRHVWAIGEDEVPFNAVERLFLDPQARTIHAGHFIKNIAPVVAMIRSAIGRRPQLTTLQRVQAKLVDNPETRELWDAYEISGPLDTNKCTIESPIGPFSYEALTLGLPGATSGIVIQVPDESSKIRLNNAMRKAE